ncbi:MAG: AmmeMemoRadiSam system protein B [Verrucomicrobia bacterium]|nr:AmmeMemoRadiSam system protein B [Verrucomicrobiota bacterium]
MTNDPRLNPDSVRRPAVAGLFYPGDGRELERTVTRFLAESKTGEHVSPKAVIAPHAGYVFSGPVAGSAFAPWIREADKTKRVVLIGPSHKVSFRGLGLSTVSKFETPMGDVAVDHDADTELLKLPQVTEHDMAHSMEHSLEVELPFLLKLFDDFKVLPLVVGKAEPREISEVLKMLWGGAETKIVVSSDLSHFLDYDSAVEMDARTARAVEKLDPDGVTFDAACGQLPMQGLLESARERGLVAETVDLRNSGDTSGMRDRVVGYGAFLFTGK